ncbi:MULTISPECIES: hypothetical protein [unclassified Synechococcus]|uniref:hypothetical protein n=1 Tax=unclassified Synechococcus TaxID=2626047 RepID=UPI0039B0A220
MDYTAQGIEKAEALAIDLNSDISGLAEWENLRLAQMEYTKKTPTLRGGGVLCILHRTAEDAIL